MRRKIIYTQRADADLARLEAFIAAESPRQAARAIARITRGLETLQEFPEIGRAIGGGMRQLVLRYGKGGYVIRYRLRDDVILITRLWHGREKR
ncbi:MAG TPA: type II toxin-antitoxin system RelE/ParE family toxin [Terricaulis sp.]|nr:type II toxin-antitoxin system RelE/ParE family toxin [Terricaulis sp.]